MKKYTSLSSEKQNILLAQMAMLTAFRPEIIEKDWWVTQVLKALFSLPYAEHLSFKGGTSLSKCWHLIDRFSEDVDIAVNREFLGYSGELSRTQISDKLRRAVCSFVREQMQFDLKEAMLRQGIASGTFQIKVNITSVSTTDPETIEVDYHSALSKTEYIRHCVRVEVSGRSMQKPVRIENVQSLIDKYLPESVVAEKPFNIPNVVTPERTFLEKVFLLHEEFSKQDHVRVDRMSRHLYDISMMMESGIADNALNDKQLYHDIVEHRRKFIHLKDFDYETLSPAKISIIPPTSIFNLWEKDYEEMTRTMIYGHSPSFQQLIKNIRELENQIHSLNL